jgi:DNA polymerase-3 subunit delta
MPALSPERLTRHLREGERGGVFFVHGAEDYLKQRAVREIVEAHLDPGTRDFNLDEVRGDEVTTETLSSLIQTPPMMGEWRVVVVRDSQALAGSSTARSIVTGTAEAPPPGLALVLEADTGGSRAKLWKTLERTAKAVEFDRLSDADLPGWLMTWARDHGIEMEVDAARALAGAVGPALAPLVRELEKLREFVGERPVTRDDVGKVVGAIPRQDRWAWMDLVGDRKFDQARHGLPVLLESGGESGVGLVIGLGNQFLRLALCVAGGKEALEAELPRNQKWLARRIVGQARKWDRPGVEAALAHLARADRLLKSAPLSDYQIMDELLLRLQHQTAA